MPAMRAWPRRVSDAVADMVFPPGCVACGRRIAAHGALCASCWPNVRFLAEPLCPVYGTPFTADLGAGAVSARAIADPPPWDRSRSAVVYDGAARRFVLSLKFQDRQDQAGWMADWMARAAPDLLADASVIVPVPLHWRRFFLRRFNQSALLAHALAKKTGKRFIPEALARIKPTVTQRGLTRDERNTNVARAFAVPEARRIDVEGRRVLLIDDVFTTGATLAASAKALRKAGASGVDCLTFALVLKPDV
ncbi:MAG: ComF family protein [Rhizobiaceae bacterium]|nr:ComF family protein [Rhizobiaceae bacterium]